MPLAGSRKTCVAPGRSRRKKAGFQREEAVWVPRRVRRNNSRSRAGATARVVEVDGLGVALVAVSAVQEQKQREDRRGSDPPRPRGLPHEVNDSSRERQGNCGCQKKALHVLIMREQRRGDQAALSPLRWSARETSFKSRPLSRPEDDLEPPSAVAGVVVSLSPLGPWTEPSTGAQIGAQSA